MNPTGKPVFLDVGGFNGLSSLFWRVVHPCGWDFDIHVFEPSHVNAELIREKNRDKKLGLVLVEKAAWISNEPQRFYYGKQDGGTLISTKKTGGIHPDQFYEVKTVDLSEYIIKNFSGASFLAIKLNCEGAEYALIKHLQERGILPLVNRWYIQWHYKKIGMTQAEHEKVVALVPGWLKWEAQTKGERLGEFVSYFRRNLVKTGEGIR